MRLEREIAVELEGKSALVVGLARSGIAAARFLARHRARVVATDVKAAQDLGPEVVTLKELGVTLELGGHRAATFAAAQVVVVSPGVPWELPELDGARRGGARVIGELELGARFISGPIAAVTGTKGKSTTTAALGAMLRAAGGDVRVGGNLGQPLTGLLEGASAATRFALEVSSFQLEGTEAFHPRVAAYLNLSADHLDRHPSFEAYARAKARIFANQDSHDWAVVNADDPLVLEAARRARARLVALHPSPAVAGPGAAGDAAWFESGEARLRLDGRTETLFALSDVRLPGPHLAGDLLAAGAAARLMGAPSEAVRRAAWSFRGLEHVLERVAEVGGVAYFNDSKATNVEAARKSLLAFTGPVWVVMGGRYKGGDFASLADEMRGRVRAVLAIGEARPLIVQALQGVVEVVPCESLRSAVEHARAHASPGDTVLLAPACSSFDMFKDYADRGEAFKREVRRQLNDNG